MTSHCHLFFKYLSNLPNLYFDIVTLSTTITPFKKKSQDETNQPVDLARSFYVHQ